MAGRYEVLEAIGDGCSGRVLRALDRRAGTPVALKLLAQPWLAGRDRVDRFLGEARAAGGIRHPGVLAATDADADPDCGPFTVSPLMPGGSLRDLLDREGALAPTRAAALVAQAADALAAAHAQGLAHGAVKPANLLLDAAGHVRVGDFGFARLRTGATRDAAYLSPEQCRGEPAGPATDQYALGVVLHELVAGRPPLTGDTAAAIAAAHVDHPPAEPPAGTPPWLRAALATALAKDPAERFASVEAFGAALRERGGGAGGAEPPRRGGAHPAATGRRRVWPARAAIGLVLLAVAGAGGLLIADARDGLLVAGDADAPELDVAPPAVAQEPERTPAPTPTPTPAPAAVEVPSLAGLTPAGARARLARRGLELSTVRRRSARRPAGRIVSQRPRAGAPSAEGATVEATVSDGPPPTAVRETERPASIPPAKTWRTVGTFSLDGDGAGASARITGDRWRIAYTATRRSCEYAVVECEAPSLDLVRAGGGSGKRLALRAGSGSAEGAGGPGTFDLTLLSHMGDWVVTVTVQELR